VSNVLACAVCFDFSAGSRAAFFATTALLSLLPLALLAGLIWYIRRVHKKRA
jgi:hypothetical protein